MLDIKKIKKVKDLNITLIILWVSLIVFLAMYISSWREVIKDNWNSIEIMVDNLSPASILSFNLSLLIGLVIFIVNTILGVSLLTFSKRTSGRRKEIF